MTTLKSDVFISGHGIHSGAPVNVSILPSDKDGIFFCRTDLPGTGLIAARFDNVGETRMRNTTVGNMAGPHVQTIEHLMAALFISGIDSAIIEIDGPETPILDGSAQQFIKSLQSVATDDKWQMRRIVVRRPVTAYAREITRTLPRIVRAKLWLMNLLSGRKNDGYVSLTPGGDNLDISATLVYREPIIGRQSFSYSFDGTKRAVDNFVKNIARARTFGKYSEWEYLKAHGMGRGADETNVIALNDAGDGTLNNLIWPDEFVRHKIIDALGDMFTSGGMIVGRLESFKGSHALNNLVLKKLFSNPDNYDIITPSAAKKRDKK